jgi:DNA-binding winged helix-turn-helix (wHTH) protein
MLRFNCRQACRSLDPGFVVHCGRLAAFLVRRAGSQLIWKEIQMRYSKFWLYDDVDAVLYADGRASRLTKKASMVLGCLLRHHGLVVRHETIASEVWPGSAIRPDIVREYVSDLRKAVGDDARRPKVIETVRGRGYRLTGDVRTVSEGSRGGPAGCLRQFDLVAETIATDALVHHGQASETGAAARPVDASFLIGSVHLVENRLKAVVQLVHGGSGRVLRTRRYEWPRMELARLRDGSVAGPRDAGDREEPATSILSRRGARSGSESRAACWPMAA